MTGTFDNWSKSEQMEKVGDKFEKSVELPDTSERIYYKVGTQTSLASFCHVFFHICLQPRTHFPSIHRLAPTVGLGSTTHQDERTMGGSVRLRACVRACVLA